MHRLVIDYVELLANPPILAGNENDGRTDFPVRPYCSKNWWNGLAHAHRCRGVLMAGNCRDTQYVLKMPDFPMFSFGTRPNAFGGWTILEVDVPIFIPGHMTHYVRVAPGDFVFGDNDGVQLIPSGLVDELLLRVEHTFEIENKEREQLAAGMPVDEVYRVFGVL